MNKRRAPQWLHFEEEVRQLVEAFGYEAERTQPSHDFGVDVIARSQRRTVVVQCKLYGKGRIGGDTIMQLVGSRTYFGASDAICITTSRYTRQAREVADKQNIRLVDRDMLIALCQQRQLTIPALTALESRTGEVVALRGATLTIGRGEDCGLILRDPIVSRHHAVLERQGLRLSLRDCGSTNGTRLNGVPVIRPTAVNYGDQVEVAGNGFVVVLRTGADP